MTAAQSINSCHQQMKPCVSHLFFVLVNVKVQFTECTQCVELIAVETRLLHQVGVHVLITDAGHFGNIPVVPVIHIQAIAMYNFKLY